MSLVILAGCGEVRSNAVDAAIDTPVIAIDAPVPPAMHKHYVIDRLLLPANNTEARAFGLDLDGDGVVDNQLGMVIATLAGMGLPTQTNTDKLIDTGAALMLPDLGADDLVTEPYATFTIYQGANPVPAPCANTADTVCRRHLLGTGSFTAKAAPVDPVLTGAIANGTLAAGPGHLTIQFAFMSSAPVVANLVGARVELMPTATAAGKLCGAMTKTDVDTVLIPAMQVGFQATVTRDCTMPTSPPACGCMADSEGKTMIGLFDTAPSDCSISVSELQNNSLIVSLLAPDITIESMPALSLGLSMHAVAATYTAP
jgi:hypothetical protein